MTITVIVQARMGSSRLPGKVLRPLAGRPMLALMLERLAGVQSGPVVVATSDRDLDTPIATLTHELGVPCIRGSETDVLGRLSLAAHIHRADHIVRLTADCPLTDPHLVDEVVATHLAAQADYTSNTLLRTFPDGLDVEVMRTSALADAAAHAHDAAEREHVTPFIYRDPARFRLAAHLGPQDLEDERWTVDTADDFEFIEDALQRRSDDAAAISWPQFLALVGRRVVDGDALVLHVRRPGAPGADLGPLVDPGHRTWDALVSGTAVGQVTVRVERGVGATATSVPDALRAAAEAALRRRLAADPQVCILRDATAFSPSASSTQ